MRPRTIARGAGRPAAIRPPVIGASVWAVLIAIAAVTLAPTPVAALGATDTWLAGGHWTRLSSSPGGLRLAMDAVRDRVLSVGDAADTGEDLHVWELALASDSAWRLLRPRGRIPLAREGQELILDSARQRLIMFGGEIDGEHSSEVWALPLSGDPQWEAVPTTGTPPPPGDFAATIYDPVRDRMIVFGGRALGSEPYVGEVWELSLGETPTWTRIVPGGSAPPPILAPLDAAAIYDPMGDRLVLYSGTEVWSLALAGSPVWTLLAPGDTAPPSRVSPLAVYDPEGQRMIVHGGSWVNYPGGPSVLRNDAWALSLFGTPEWTLLAPDGSGPSGNPTRTAVYDPSRQRMLVSVGDGLWALALSGAAAWSSVHTPVRFPAGGRTEASLVLDPGRDQMLVFGGMSWASSTTSEVWAWSLGAGGWSRVVASGTPPESRAGQVAVFDPPRDRMVVFGGYAPGLQSMLNDLWELRLTPTPAWSPLAASGVPPAARMYATAAYDPALERMILYGGVDAGSVFFGDVWELSLSGAAAWNQLTPAGPAPEPRVGNTLTMDSLRSRLLLFGGATATYPYVPEQPLWGLSLSGTPTWSPIAVAGESPGSPTQHSAAHDPLRDRILVFGGDGGHRMDSLWALSLADEPAWARLAPLGRTPLWRIGHAAISDPLRDRMVLFGGSSPAIHGSYLDDVWEHRWTRYGTSVVAQPPAKPMLTRADAVIVPEQAPPLRLLLDPITGGAGAVPLALELPAGSRVSLVVHDVTGRAVRTLAQGTFEAGRHALTWDRRDAHGRKVAGGIYFVRLVADAGRVTRKLVVLP